MKIGWLLPARRDLESIAAYHRKVASKAVADRPVKRIAHSASFLKEKPYLGHPSGSGEEVHELQVPHLPYLLPYRVHDDRLETLRVVHEARERPDEWA